ncbi:MAG TPA: TolC family protein [Terriglobia bacterium]|nr:TolC family protein [Terriglobia bacterium]
MKKAIGIGVLGLFTAACAVGPRYQPPAVSLPEAYRGGEAEQPAPSPDSLADLEWSQVFQDEALRQLIRAGLERNLDLRMAAARILQAQAQVGFLRADEFPTVDGNVQWTSLRTASSRFTAFEISELGLQLSSRWEVDFWKKFRSTTQAAQASLLASEAARQAVIRTLVAEIAAAYFELRELDAEL